MDTPNIGYCSIQHYFIEHSTVYEKILVELLNLSKMKEQYGNFVWEEKQSNGEPDATSERGYSIDFKLLISEDVCEFRNTTKPIKTEICPGAIAISPPDHKEAEVVLLFNALRGMDETKLEQNRKWKDRVSKAVVHFYDKVISKKKNIMLFVPLYLYTVEDNMTDEQKQMLIADEIYAQNKYIYEYRSKRFSGYDTYMVYVEDFSHQCERSVFVISRLSENKLEIIDRIPMFSLSSVKQQYDLNRIF